MRFPELVPAVFVCRDNRFRATVLVAGRKEAAHVASPGRMGELLLPDRRVWLARADAPGRVTAYTLALVEHEGVWVSVDSRLPNRLFREALQSGNIPALAGMALQPEVRLGASRLDYRLSGADGEGWVELKSVTLVRQGLALFPDAPTARGRRHLEELGRAAVRGERALVVFIVQRPDAVAVVPNSETDPAFAQALARAVHAGVEAWAFVCQVTPAHIVVDRPVPVLLAQGGVEKTIG